jgi:hypothetical protein
LIAWIVLFLSGAQASFTSQHPSRWVVIEKGLEKKPEVIAMLDSLKNQGFEGRYLERNFPLFSDSAITEPHNYWSLVEELRSKKNTEVAVISYNYVNRFRGDRTSLPGNIRWITIEPEPVDFVAEAVRLNGDSVSIKAGHSTYEATSFKTKHEPLSTAQNQLQGSPSSTPIPITNPDTITIVLANDPAFDYDSRIVLASLRAVQTITPHKLNITTTNTRDWNAGQKYDWLIWLGESAPATHTGRSIVFKSCLTESIPVISPSSEVSSICKDVKDHDWIITQRLNEEIAIKENISIVLASILLPEKEEAHANDRRVLAESMMWSVGTKTTSGISGSTPATSLAPYLAVLILLTLLTERWVAYKRNQ